MLNLRLDYFFLYPRVSSRFHLRATPPANASNLVLPFFLPLPIYDKIMVDCSQSSFGTSWSLTPVCSLDAVLLSRGKLNLVFSMFCPTSDFCCPCAYDLCLLLPPQIQMLFGFGSCLVTLPMAPPSGPIHVSLFTVLFFLFFFPWSRRSSTSLYYLAPPVFLF